MPRLARVVAGFAICMGCCRAALGDGVFMDGNSARPIGRGGTNIAHVDNGTILLDNPSAIVDIYGDSMLEVGVTGLITDFYYADPQNPGTSISEIYGMPEFTYIRRGPSEYWAYGVGVYAPAGFGSRFTLEGPPQLPGPQLYKSFAAMGRVLPAVAYQATDRLSIGATLGVGVLITDFEGPYILQSSLPGVPTYVDLDAGGAALSWSVGMRYKLTDATTVAATYQSENRFNARGDTNIFVPGLGDFDYRTRMQITWPQSVGLGLRHELTRCDILSLDLVWYDWSSAFDQIGLRLYNSTNPIPEIRETFPLNWRDSLSTRVGYEHRLGGHRTVRLGYVHHRVPVPANTMTPFIPAALENAFSVGYGTQVCCWNVDIAYMFSFGPTVYEGQSAFIGGDFDDSTHRDRTHAIALTFMRQW